MQIHEFEGDNEDELMEMALDALGPDAPAADINVRRQGGLLKITVKVYDKPRTDGLRRIMIYTD